MIQWYKGYTFQGVTLWTILNVYLELGFTELSSSKGWWKGSENSE